MFRTSQLARELFLWGTGHKLVREPLRAVLVIRRAALMRFGVGGREKKAEGRPAALGTEGGSGWQLDETESGEWG